MTSPAASEPDRRSYVCPFCDSTYAIEFSRDGASRERPELVIGFAITPENAHEAYRSLTNGQTGKVAEDKPLPWRNVAAAMLLVLGAVAAVAAIGYFAGR